MNADERRWEANGDFLKGFAGYGESEGVEEECAGGAGEDGVAVAGGGDGFTMEDCEIHRTAAGGFEANGTGTPIRNLTMRRCHIHDISLTGKWYETPVNGCCLFKDVQGGLVEDVFIERGYGEGIAAGFRSHGVVFRRVTVRDTTHLAMYVANCATDVLVEDCVVYQTGLAEFRQGDGDVGAGYVVGDEVAEGKDANRPHSENVTLRRCVVARLSGDEFGLILHDCPLVQAEAIARKLVTAIGELAFTASGDLKDFKFVVYEWHKDASKTPAQ